jgi:hypothetical protein
VRPPNSLLSEYNLVCRCLILTDLALSLPCLPEPDPVSLTRCFRNPLARCPGSSLGRRELPFAGAFFRQSRPASTPAGSDYCYSDRLLHEYEIHFHNPWLSGFACYSITFRLSFLPPKRNSGTKCLSGTVTRFPKDPASVSENPEPKPFII